MSEDLPELILQGVSKSDLQGVILGPMISAIMELRTESCNWPIKKEFTVKHRISWK